MPKSVFGLAALYAGLLGVALLCAGEAPAPGPAAEPVEVKPPRADTSKGQSMPEGIEWFAVNQWFVEDKNALVLSGSAWVKAPILNSTIKLEADQIVFFRTTKEVYAEGHIRLMEGESEISAEVAYVDIANDRGFMVDATMRVSMKQNEEKRNPADLAKKINPDDEFARAVKGEGQLIRNRDPYGVYLDVVDDPQARVNFVFKAQTIVRESRLHISARDAFLTTDDMADPLYGLKLAKLDIYMREIPHPTQPFKPRMVRGEGARFKLGPVTLFPLPAVTWDLTKHLGYVRFDAGNSKLYGPYALFRFGLGLGGHERKLFDPTRLYFDLDARLKRGPAAGAEFRYQTGVRPEDPEAAKEFERGRGLARVYATDETWIDKEDDRARAVRNRERRVQPKLDGYQRRLYDANDLFSARRRLDNAGPPSLELDLYKDNVRGLADFAHHQPLNLAFGLRNVELDFKYQRRSDRDFELDYFRNNYLTANQPEALLSARKAGDNYSAELLYRANPAEFDGAPPRSPVDFGTFTGYEPAFTYSMLPFGLGRGFYVSGEAQVARLRREFERAVIDQDVLEASRAYGQLHVERPFRALGFTVRPHVGGQIAAYDDSREDSGTVQAAPIYGVDVSTRIYGTFAEARNDELGLLGFRHILEPRVEYLAVGDTQEDPLAIFDFDEVDDLRSAHRVRLAFDQTFQTRVVKKDGRTASRNFAALNMSVDWFPRVQDADRLLNGDHLDLFRVDGYLQVIDAVRVGGEIGVNLEGGQAETAVYNLELDPGGRWRLQLQERYNFTDRDRKVLGSDQIGLRFEFQISERWGLTLDQKNERTKGFLARKGRQVQAITVTRRYGPLVGAFSYQFDKNNNDSSFGFSLAPAYAYRNLVVPTTHLLAPTGEVSEADTPEERNFDPFEVLKRSGGKKKTPRKKTEEAIPARPPSSAPPPPPAPGDGAGGAPRSAPAPAPAEEVPLPSDGKAGAEAPARRPAEPLVKKRPANLDRDDWAYEPAPSAKKPE